MNLSNEKAGVGKFASPRLKILRDGVQVGVADFNPIEGGWVFESLIFETEGQAILRGQRMGATEAQYTRILKELEDAIAAASLTTGELHEVKKYVSALAEPDSAIDQVDKTPTLNLRPTVDIPLPVFQTESADIIDMKAQLADLKNKLEDVQEHLRVSDSQWSNLENKFRAHEILFRTHVKVCGTYSNYSEGAGGGFSRQP
jgi:hypothetical protein